MPDKNRLSSTVGVVAEPSSLLSKPIASERRWWHWHEPGTTKEEKWLIFKLDFYILLYSCLVFPPLPPSLHYIPNANLALAFLDFLHQVPRTYKDLYVQPWVGPQCGNSKLKPNDIR